MINNLVNKITSALEFFGSEQTLDMVQYTLLRDSLDSRYLKKDSDFFSPGQLRRKEISDLKVDYVFENAVLTVKLILPNALFISWSTENSSEQVLDFSSGFKEGVKINVTQEDFSTTIWNDFMRIIVMDNGDLIINDSAGNFLRKDSAPLFRKQGYSQKLEIRKESAIMGFGEKAFPLNLRGRRLKLWNRDADGRYGPGADPLYVNSPVYLDGTASSIFMTFHENTSEAFFRIGEDEPNTIEMDFSGGNDRYYVIFGSIEDIYLSYGKITGFPNLPPVWSLGFHQSRWGYMTSSQIEEIANGFIDNDFPVSAIHMDIDYMDGFRIFTFDRTRFPDIREMAANLKSKGIRLVTIIDPGIKWDPEYFMYKEGIDGKRFVQTPEGDTLKAPVWPGLSAFPDFSSEDVQKWWGQKYDFMLDSGISGFWHDMNEPAAFVLWGENTLPLSSVHRKGSHRSVHNVYGYFMGKAAHDSLSRDPERERPFILSRAGFAGQQKYTWFWTGDTDSSWDELRQTIFSALGMSLSGFPYIGSDIGGFWGEPSPELFTRWFQMAAFMPFFRTHSGKDFRPREPWQFGQPYLDILRNAAKTRYRLMPYIYSAFYQSHKSGQPVMRPLFWMDHSLIYSSNAEEFLLGENLLVAPVTKEGLESITVTLPGCGWYDFHDPSVFHKEPMITMPLTLERIPVFVKEGSIIPTLHDNRLHIGIYLPHSDSEFTFTMYSDDSKNSSTSRLDHFYGKLSSGELHLSWRRDGEYDFQYSAVVVEIFGAPVTAISVDSDGKAASNVVEVSSPFNEMQAKIG